MTVAHTVFIYKKERDLDPQQAQYIEAEKAKRGKDNPLYLYQGKTYQITLDVDSADYPELVVAQETVLNGSEKRRPQQYDQTVGDLKDERNLAAYSQNLIPFTVMGLYGSFTPYFFLTANKHRKTETLSPAKNKDGQKASKDYYIAGTAACLFCAVAATMLICNIRKAVRLNGEVKKAVQNAQKAKQELLGVIAEKIECKKTHSSGHISSLSIK